ncbi:MAG: hypothetical protein HY775_04715 [Acidobacteria bacterium]|nr:hypothetical protein [Acidobacteriota bacterium]
MSTYEAGSLAARRHADVRELRDSLMLLGLAAASLGGYVGIAFAAVRLLGAR